MAQMNLFAEKIHMDLGNRLVVAKGVGEGSRMDWEFGVSRGKLLHLEGVSNEILLYSTGMEKNRKRN